MSNSRQERKDRGLPGGGAGRKDEVGGSGAYPASGPFPSGNADLKGQATWGQGEASAGSYERRAILAPNYGRKALNREFQNHHGKQILDVRFPVDGVVLEGELALPEDLYGIVLFADGSGGSRHRPHNQFVAGVLQDAGIATFLFDMLTEEEESSDQLTRHPRFNIALLARRLLRATFWVSQAPRIKDVKLGYFGVNIGAAAALGGAAQAAGEVAAIVSFGGTPALTESALSKVDTPTLLTVGGEDPAALELNRRVLGQLVAEKDLKIVPGATHLFEEPGALEEAALLSRQWFEWHLGRRMQAA